MHHKVRWFMCKGNCSIQVSVRQILLYHRIVKQVVTNSFAFHIIPYSYLAHLLQTPHSKAPFEATEELIYGGPIGGWCLHVGSVARGP